MNTSINLKTRREFLRTTVLGGSMAWMIPSFVSTTFDSLHAAAAASTGQIATGKDSPILVLLMLGGGNDGLNTIVPYTNDFYHQARPNLGIKNPIKINDQYGLHPTLTAFKSLYDSGNLGIIQGVGYPNGSRSHFRSTTIWHTSPIGDTQRTETTGWIGRYFDCNCAGAEPTVGMNVGRVKPELFISNKVRTVSLAGDPNDYRFKGGDRFKDEKGTIDQAYKKLNRLDGSTAMGGMSEAPKLDFLEKTALDAQFSSDKVLAILNKTKPRVQYPDSNIAENLQNIATLIAGGISTKVFYTQHGNYDTHVNQQKTHPQLLTELSQAMKAFRDDLKAQGNLNRVITLVFSEMGRRVQENAGGNGTDHGLAAPVFVMGGTPIQHGLLGTHPSLDPKDMDHGDIQFSVDFRSIYAEVLQKWLKADSAPILGADVKPFSFIV